jgi:hypothetical protein
LELSMRFLHFHVGLPHEDSNWTLFYLVHWLDLSDPPFQSYKHYLFLLTNPIGILRRNLSLPSWIPSPRFQSETMLLVVLVDITYLTCSSCQSLRHYSGGLILLLYLVPPLAASLCCSYSKHHRSFTFVSHGVSSVSHCVLLQFVNASMSRTHYILPNYPPAVIPLMHLTITLPSHPPFHWNVFSCWQVKPAFMLWTREALSPLLLALHPSQVSIPISHIMIVTSY